MKKKVVYLLVLLLAAPLTVLGYLHFLFGKKLPVEQLQDFILHSEVKGLDVRYYGTACFYIGYNGKGIVTDPFFSNPGVLRSLTALRPDATAVDAITSLPWSSVYGFVIGHTHYDHCLELAEAMDKAHPDAVTLGNTSLQRLFPMLEDGINFINADSSRAMVYLADSSIRIYPVESAHSPHIGKIIIADGDMAPGTFRQPLNWLRWKRGTNYSYLVDFLEEGRIVKRVFVNGGENIFPSTAEERDLLSLKQVDVLITPFWDHKVMEGRMARNNDIFGNAEVIYCHWNNFFRAHDKPLQYIRKSRLAEGIAVLQLQQPLMPMHIMLPEQSQ